MLYDTVTRNCYAEEALKASWRQFLKTSIVPNFFDFNNDQLTQILFKVKKILIVFKVNNTNILDATINYLIETKRFDAQLFYALRMSKL